MGVGSARSAHGIVQPQDFGLARSNTSDASYRSSGTGMGARSGSLQGRICAVVDRLLLALKRAVNFLFRRADASAECETVYANRALDTACRPDAALPASGPPPAGYGLLVRGQFAPDGEPYSSQSVAACLSLADLRALSQTSRAMRKVAREAFGDVVRNPIGCTAKEVLGLVLKTSTRHLVLQSRVALWKVDYLALLKSPETVRLVFETPGLLAVAAARERLTERPPPYGYKVFSHWKPFIGSHPEGEIHAAAALVGNREFMLTVCRSPDYPDLYQGLVVYQADYEVFRTALRKVVPELTKGPGSLPANHPAVLFLQGIVQRWRPRQPGSA